MSKSSYNADMEKTARNLLSDEDLAQLEQELEETKNLIARGYKKYQINRQYNLRAAVRRWRNSGADGFARETARVNHQGFAGEGGGRMATVVPPVEYRATSVQVAGLFPWIVGAKAPLLGTPLGRHLGTGAAVGFDPLYAWKMKAITAPSCVVCALNGVGKSTVLRKLAVGDIARGTLVLVPGDVKPDLRILTEKVGGQVSAVGYGTGAINVLDRGPIGLAIAQLPAGVERERCEFALHARQVNMLAALLEIVRRSPLKDFEETLLSAAIRLIYAPSSQFSIDHPALIEDLLNLITEGPNELMLAAVADTATEYRDQIKPLLRSMRAVIDGQFGETFNRPSTVRIDITKPMVNLDMSSVPPGDEKMRAAVLLAGWNEAFAAIEAAHILVDNAVPGAKARAAHVIMDEFWQVLQAGASMVTRVDAVQRLQRTYGVATTVATHSLAEFEKVGALGMIERSRARIIGAIPDAELERLSKFMKFSEAERAMVTNWATSTTTAVDEKKALRHARTGEESGAPRTAAGVGNFLLKLGEGSAPGTPFKVWVTPAEHAAGVHDTDARLRAADADRDRVTAA